MYHKLEEILLEVNKSVYQLCKETGIKTNVIYNWKRRSVNNPDAQLSVENIKKISANLQIPIERLM